MWEGRGGLVNGAKGGRVGGERGGRERRDWLVNGRGRVWWRKGEGGERGLVNRGEEAGEERGREGGVNGGEGGGG